MLSVQVCVFALDFSNTESAKISLSIDNVYVFPGLA